MLPAPVQSRSSWFGAHQTPGARLCLLSFTALFLELMVIRWVPSEVRLVAYYANLMLVSSFLGLGLGAILGTRQWKLFRFFPILLALDILFLVAAGHATLPGSGEWRFQIVDNKPAQYAVLLLVFVLNAAVFVPLGEEIGLQFQRRPALRAYLWDLLGSLCGTVAFGIFSFLHFSPLLGMLLVAVFGLAATVHRRWAALPFYAIALGAIAWSGHREHTWWSPYYHITIREYRVQTERPVDGKPQLAWLAEGPADAPPPQVRTMQDPPLYIVKVNQDFYQLHGTIDRRRYVAGGPKQQVLTDLFSQYELPYNLVPPPERVLVLGAGGGMDVEMALVRGAKRVDAVEIDPVIPALSNRYSASAPYADPRVVLHINDARAFLQRSTEQFDLVVFGYLDSQALFSYGASLRLDGYTYTVEGLRTAFSRVAPHGAMAVSFVAGREWMVHKLIQMVQKATGLEPLVYVREGKVTLLASKTPPTAPPQEIAGWKRLRLQPKAVDLATDDWPYLYLQAHGIPTDYRIIIGALLVISLGILLALRGTAFSAGDGHFLFMGWAFLLLQTKSIGDCSLYFGTTWLVTTIVITGVLLMVLLANGVALRWVRSFRPWYYLPLFASLAVLLMVSRETILAQPLPLRFLWTILVVPLPIFFAGLIFSTTFRESRQPALSLGANLIGATIGGFCEYLGMWIGSEALSTIVVAVYAASLVCLLRQRRSSQAAIA